MFRSLLDHPRYGLHVRQGLKFIMSGGIGSAVDLCVLPLLVRFAGVHPDLAFYLSSFCGATTVFFLNKYLTFKNAEPLSLKQFLKFWTVYGPSIVLNGMISMLLRGAGLPYMFAKAIAIALLIPMNYLFSHGFVFKKTKEQENRV